MFKGYWFNKTDVTWLTCKYPHCYVSIRNDLGIGYHWPEYNKSGLAYKFGTYNRTGDAYKFGTYNRTGKCGLWATSYRLEV